MRLNEEKLAQYVRRLTKELNIKRLGRGNYAHVFKHPTHPDVVVKVFTADSGYERYLRFVKKNQRNKYVPRIIDHVRIPDKDVEGGWYNIVFMEKLTRASYDDLHQEMSRWARLAGLKHHDQFSTPEELDLEDFEKLAYQTEDRDLAAVAREFLTLDNDDDEYFDLHDGNVMMRGNQLVIIDPYATNLN